MRTGNNQSVILKWACPILLLSFAFASHATFVFETSGSVKSYDDDYGDYGNSDYYENRHNGHGHGNRPDYNENYHGNYDNYNGYGNHGNYDNNYHGPRRPNNVGSSIQSQASAQSTGFGSSANAQSNSQTFHGFPQNNAQSQSQGYHKYPTDPYNPYGGSGASSASSAASATSGIVNGRPVASAASAGASASPSGTFSSSSTSTSGSHSGNRPRQPWIYGRTSNHDSYHNDESIHRSLNNDGIIFSDK